MLKKLLVGVVGLAILAGVGMLVAGNLRDSAFHRATAERDYCYAQQGYGVGSGSATLPDEVRRRCIRTMDEYFEGETKDYLYGGLAGLAAAAVFLLLAWFFLLRRRPGSDGA
jgi:hypothetical protein